jgi:diguanylate cyclase (GGDEF)-like protein
MSRIHPNFESNPPSVLLVHEDEAVRAQLRQPIDNRGYLTVEAATDAQCLQLCGQVTPDLIVLPAKGAGIDGFACCEQLQQLLGDRRPPILMAIADDDDATVRRALAVGASECIRQPISPPLLERRVHHLLTLGWAARQLDDLRRRERQLNDALTDLQEELELFVIDPSTQIPHRRYFDEYLDREWRRLARDLEPLSLILGAIDCFQLYNEVYGIEAGDECLQQIARAIAATVKRPADLVARYGGDSFAAILPKTDGKGATDVAEEMRRQIKDLAIAHERSPVSSLVTVSFGVASVIPRPALSSDRDRDESRERQLIEAAENALQEAKEQGRDRIIFQQVHLSPQD